MSPDAPRHWPADDSGIPIPTRAVILERLSRQGKPLALPELAKAIDVSGSAALRALERRLARMKRDGLVVKNRRGAFGLPSHMDMLYGRISGHRDGYGFVVPDAGGGDLYLSPRQMRKAMHGDRVLARVTGVDRRGRREGTIVEVIAHHNRRVVGHFFREGGVAFVAPDDKRIVHDILVPADSVGAARAGHIVVVELTQQPLGHRQAVGRVIEVLGEHLAPGMETEIAIRKYDLPHGFTDEVLAAAQRRARPLRARDVDAREDLRALPLVTIDGEDARDFDDAVFCEPGPSGGWRLIVAIADVSRYVRPGDVLDEQARERGNSVYFPDRVVPMLPEALSNGICSLNPGEDRLCVACEMIIDRHGKTRRYRFFEGVMRSRARLTYTAVAAALTGDATVPEAVRPHVAHLQGVFETLHAARRRRGSLDLDLPESRVVLDDSQRVQAIEPLLRNDAHRLIEECMLAANTCAAEFLAEQGPAIYRAHDEPDPEKVLELRRFLGGLGLAIGGGERPDAAAFSEVVAASASRPELGELIQMTILRTMSQAVYRAEATGHFALGYAHYTHFTSPIRRYPDLVVHRLIKRALGTARMRAIQPVELAQIAEHCSMTERRADDATRDVIQGFKAEFMLDKIGEEFDGTINGVVDFGIFVQLAQCHVDGLVHVTGLGDDYFHFDPKRYQLVGERSGVVHRLGDPVRVRVARVDLDQARVDFDLVASAARGRGRRRRGQGLRRKARR